jgi:hypothetical protein
MISPFFFNSKLIIWSLGNLKVTIIKILTRFSYLFKAKVQYICNQYSHINKVKIYLVTNKLLGASYKIPMGLLQPILNFYKVWSLGN